MPNRAAKRRKQLRRKIHIENRLRKRELKKAKNNAASRET